MDQFFSRNKKIAFCTFFDKGDIEFFFTYWKEYAAVTWEKF